MSTQVNSKLKNIDIEKIPFKKRIEAFYEGTRAAAELAKQVMIPQLKALINPSKKEEIIKGLYFRMYAWMLTLVSLKDTVHFQATASAARSIFELLLDIKLLIEDKPANPIDKFEAFIQVEKFRAAKKYVEFKKSNPGLKYKSGLAKEKLVNKPGEENRINTLIVLNWGKDKKGKSKRIEHWTGWKINKRAEETGKDYELFYHESFALLSWYLHPGLVGIKGMSTESLEVVFGNSHMLATPLFLDATLLVAKELKLIQAIPQLIDWIKEAELAVGKVIIEEHIKILESNNPSK
ncbi:MAG: DUF5677 domain-containing protein [Candidatus Omnitrophota bacterium]